MKLVKTRVGERFDRRIVSEDLERLLNTGNFYSYGTQTLIEKGVRGGVNVIFKVMELPIVATFVVKDFKEISSQRIISHLKKQKLFLAKGDRFDHRKARQINKSIRKFLAEEGFKTTIVNFSAKRRNIYFSSYFDRNYGKQN